MAEPVGDVSFHHRVHRDDPPSRSLRRDEGFCFHDDVDPMPDYEHVLTD